MKKANISDTEAAFLDLQLSTLKGFVLSNIYYKRDDFDFDIVYVPFLEGDVPCSPSYGVYISQLIRFATICRQMGLFYGFKQIVGGSGFSGRFEGIVKRYIGVGCGLDVVWQSACLALGPIAVYSYGFFIGCTTVGQASDSMIAQKWGFGQWVDAWCLSVAGPSVA